MTPGHALLLGCAFLVIFLPLAPLADSLEPADQFAHMALASKASDKVTGAIGFRIGDRIGQDSLHPVTRPGLYGIGRAPSGSSYGITEGRLIRYDPETMQIQSVIRRVDGILD